LSITTNGQERKDLAGLRPIVDAYAEKCEALGFHDSGAEQILLYVAGLIEQVRKQTIADCAMAGPKGSWPFPVGARPATGDVEGQRTGGQEREALLIAATSCPHTIDRDAVTLRFDPAKPGKNALAQLGQRLEAALVTRAKPQQREAPAVPQGWREAFQEARDAILHGRGPLESVLDGDQTNDVLAVLDGAFEAMLAAAAPQAPAAQPASQYVAELAEMMGWPDGLSETSGSWGTLLSMVRHMRARYVSPTAEMILYEHADGRARVCAEGQAHFAAGDPQWVRCYPVEIEFPAAPAVPQGFVLVPVEPTDAMVLAMRSGWSWGIENAWAEALAAAPQAPAAQPAGYVDAHDLAALSHDFEPVISKSPVSEFDVPLFAAPPPAARVTLSDEQIIDIWEEVSDPDADEISMVEFGRAIEAAVSRQPGRDTTPRDEWPIDANTAAGHLVGMAFGSAPSDELGHCLSLINAALQQPGRDAARYRWLRNSQQVGRVVFDENLSWRPSGSTLDAAVDAAMLAPDDREGGV